MNEENRCYTYFKITGNFDPADITATLSLSPSKQWNIGDSRKGGTKYDFALWEYGRCNNYDVFVENQMMRTIEKLVPKIKELKAIKRNYDVTFTLEIVPTIYVGKQNPCLAPSRPVIEFCYHTKTDIDIDLYIYDSDEVDD